MESKSIYYVDVRPVLIRNRASRSDRTMAFEIIKCRQTGKELSLKQDQFDRSVLLKWGIDTKHFVPFSIRRVWQDQPD